MKNSDCQIIAHNGYLKKQCTSNTYLKTTFRCATSPEVEYHFHSFVDFLRYATKYRCQGDDGFYQLCGLVQDFGASVYTVGSDGSIALCGYQLCEDNTTEFGTIWSTCSLPKQDQNGTCDNFCDDKEHCLDESYCNGVQYGVFCVSTWGDNLHYQDPSKVFHPPLTLSHNH